MPNTSTTAKPDDRKLTIKQRKFIEHYLKHGNATKAALYAYDCKDEASASALGSEVLRKLSIDDLMEQAGISDRKLLQKLDEGLDATKPISALVLATSGKDGVLRTKGDEGRIEVEDYAVRHKYLETAFKLKKRLSTGAAAPVAVQVNTIVSDDRSRFR